MSDSPLYDAVLDMANALACSEAALSHFTCEEADAIAAAIGVAGLKTQAMGCLIGHATGYGPGEGDDADDSHHEIAEAWWTDEQRAITVAREYVERMVQAYG